MHDCSQNHALGAFPLTTGHAGQLVRVGAAFPDPHDSRVVDLWVNGQASSTQRAYRRYARQFFAHVQKPLLWTTLDDLQAFANHVGRLPLQAGSRQRFLSAIKSLFTFAAELKYLPFDTAAPLRLPAVRDTLADRILEAEDVKRLIAAIDNPRDRLLVYLLYMTGFRRSELAGLRWRDIKPRGAGGVATVMGKGGKTRTVHLQGQIWTELANVQRTTKTDAIFVSRLGRPLSGSQVLRVVKAAAKHAGIDRPVSPHWLRHCHASHALDNGAPLHLVQQTLGHTNIATTTKYLHARPNESSGRFLPPI